MDNEPTDHASPRQELFVTMIQVKNADYYDASLPIEQRVDDLLSRMTLTEKIGQMTQVEKNSIEVSDIPRLGIGSILSGGGGNPTNNNPAEWRKMVTMFLEAAQRSRLGIPLIYGSDAVHGHNNVRGATIFPHNIGLGASRDADLVRRIAQATAREMEATQVRWNFAPAVSHPRDIRWGRTYEGYGQDVKLITKLGRAYVEGLVEMGALPSVKHFVADGGTSWGTSTRIPSDHHDLIANDPTLANAKVGEWMLHYLRMGAWKLDQGVSDIDEATLRHEHLPPYIAAIEAGAMNIMVSYSSWNGLRMHAQRYLLTDVLKNELGFDGFLVTDWEAIDQIDVDFYTSVVQAINAGIDMNMVPFKYHRFFVTLRHAVENDDVLMERIDDAVRRILRVKMKLGLFEQPYCDVPLEVVGCAEHRALAREAVHKSAVLLKNDDNLLPLNKDLEHLLVAGVAAHDIGYQCGGWTVEWMGGAGILTPGTTILEGIKALTSAEIVYDPAGEFEQSAPVGLVVIAEEPYAEGMGDREDLHISAEQIALIKRVRSKVEKLIVVLMSGRPMIITEQLPQIDAFVAAFLPGTEGDGISDLIFGVAPFTGRLSYVWPRTMAQVPLNQLNGQCPLFEYGHGL